jgi:Protein of unknown function (DUF2630)
MSDNSILQHIAGLVEEEHRIREGSTLSAADAQRLRHVAEQLDQCWDLLRQRRAKREFGADPATAQPRDAGTVERYEG